MMPNMNPFVRKFNRPLLGCEALIMQGVPKQMLLKVLAKDDKLLTDACMRDMAGNAYAGSVFMAMLIALLTHLPGMPHESLAAAAPSAEEELDLDSILECIC